MDVDTPAPAQSSSSSFEVDIPQQVGDFKLVVQDQLEFAPSVHVAKWQSESTGLKVRRPLLARPCAADGLSR